VCGCACGRARRRGAQAVQRQRGTHWATPLHVDDDAIMRKFEVSSTTRSTATLLHS